MLKKCVLIAALFIASTIFCFSFIAPLQAALETRLLVDVSPSSDNAPYTQTQWYGFSATANKGYCAILSPSTGNADVYLLDNSFNLRTSSKNTGLTVDKVWYGNSLGGVFHLGVYGTANPSTNYAIQVITAPYVTTISPASGSAGILVTITGLGFGDTQGSSYLNFGTIKATSYASWTNTQIKVYVPSGVASGVIQVVVYVANKASNPSNFTGSNNSSDGTMWKYDLGRTGNYPNGPTALPLNLRWSYATPDTVPCSPVVANNILYVKVFDVSTFTGKLCALDASTGAFKWSYSVVAGGIDAPPAVASGMVYFGSAGVLYALDANTGSLKWKYNTGISNSVSSPAVLNNIVYFTAYKTLYALDANTGALKWTYVAAAEIGESIAIFNNVIYFGDVTIGSVNGKIYAINASSGSVKWIYALSNQNATGTPAVANGILYTGVFGIGSTPCGILALDANAGTVKWQNNYSSSSFSAPALGNGLVFATGAKGSILYAFDANTGAVKWTALGGFAAGVPIVSNGLVFAGGGGKFYALDANSGSIKWSYSVSCNVGNYATPSVYNGKVYVHAQGGYLYCFGQ